MIEIKTLSFSFKKKTVIDQLELKLETGIIGVLGPNGAGKTTLFRCLCGLYENYSGKIHINGDDILHKCNRIGYLPQHFAVIPYVKVKDIMYYYATLKGIPYNNRKEEIQKALNIVDLEDYADVNGHILSGGMIRRLGIAISIMGDPDVMIMDEPTVGLDPVERQRFIELVRVIGVGRTILLSTHIIDDLRGNCDAILVLKSGQVAFLGTEDTLCQISDDGTLENGYFKVMSDHR